MHIKYFISSLFNYSDMICNDAGPNYARTHGWDVYPLNDLFMPTNSINTINIIDNRITSAELTRLQDFIEHSDSIFVLKLGDSSWDVIDQPYIKFLLNLTPRKGLFILSPYPAIDIGDRLSNIHGVDNFIVLPYAYNLNSEMEIPFCRRKKRLVISGNMNPEAYPLRAAVHRETYHKLWSTMKTKYLKHCGYPDIGQPMSHTIVKGKYIEFLSNYYFMLVTPSIWDYELLKYSECAMAGCVPVGKKPSTLRSLPSEYFYELDSVNIRESISKLFKLSINDIENMAQGYRNHFRIQRSKNVLHNQLLARIMEAL